MHSKPPGSLAVDGNININACARKELQPGGEDIVNGRLLFNLVRVSKGRLTRANITVMRVNEGHQARYKKSKVPNLASADFRLHLPDRQG